MSPFLWHALDPMGLRSMELGQWKESRKWAGVEGPDSQWKEKGGRLPAPHGDRDLSGGSAWKEEAKGGQESLSFGPIQRLLGSELPLPPARSSAAPVILPGKSQRVQVPDLGAVAERWEPLSLLL